MRATALLSVQYRAPGNPGGIVEAYSHRPFQVIENPRNLLGRGLVLRRPGNHPRTVAVPKVETLANFRHLLGITP